MKRRSDIPTEVGNLLSAAEQHDAAAIVYDYNDRVVVCNDFYRSVYKFFDCSTNHTYGSLVMQTITKGLLDDPEAKTDPNKWIQTAVNFRRRHKKAQYLVHHSSGKTFLAHHQVFDGFGSIALRFDVTERLKIQNRDTKCIVPRFDLFAGKWFSQNLVRRFEAPTAILSRSCSMIDANESFHEILEKREGIYRDGSRVSLWSADEDALFQKIVAEKSFPGASGSRLFQIQKKSGRTCYILSVFPMSPDASESNPSMHGVALVSVLDPESSVPVNARSLESMFGLTAMEARIAALIGEGKSLYEISGDNGTAIGTIRNQLKSVFSKVGVNRQSELVRIIHKIAQVEALYNSKV